MANRYEKAKEYTEKYKDVLLPCRTCGNKKIVITSDRAIFGDNKNYWSFCCSTHACDCTGFFTSVKKAIQKWNEKQTTKGAD